MDLPLAKAHKGQQLVGMTVEEPEAATAVETALAKTYALHYNVLLP